MDYYQKESRERNTNQIELIMKKQIINAVLIIAYFTLVTAILSYTL